MALEINPNDTQGFLDRFLSPEEKVTNTEPVITNSPIQNAINDLTKPTPKEGEGTKEEPKPGTEPVKQPELSKEELEKSLNKEPDNKQAADDKLFIKDVAKFSETLKEKNLLIPYEDGSLPATEEDLYDAIAQSSQFQVQQSIEAAWKERVESLPPSLLRIHEYAAKGVTTAQELADFTNAVAQTELVGSFDPKNVDNQEQIVMLQLINTGLDEKTAREEVADLKAQNKLEERATRFFPTLKRAYDENVRRKEVDKAETLQEQERYIQTNAANVTYFLEKETSYLPFTLDNKDKAFKRDIFQLAGQPIEITEDGSPVFGWQRQIESLQYGTEEDYKKFMKVMAFLANDKRYDEGVSKKVKTATEVKEFKKIGTTSGTSVNQLYTEQQNQVVPGIKKKDTVLNPSAWGR